MVSHSAGQEGVNTRARRPNLYQGTSGERWELAHYFNWIFQCAEQVSRFALALLSEELFLSAEGKEKEKPVGSEEGLSEVMQDDKASGLRPR